MPSDLKVLGLSSRSSQLGFSITQNLLLKILIIYIQIYISKLKVPEVVGGTVVVTNVVFVFSDIVVDIGVVVAVVDVIGGVKVLEGQIDRPKALFIDLSKGKSSLSQIP